MAESHASPRWPDRKQGASSAHSSPQRTNMPTSFWPNKVGQSTSKGLQKGTHNRHWTAFRPFQEWAGRTGDRSHTPPDCSGKGKGSGATSTSMAPAGSDIEAEDPQPRHLREDPEHGHPPAGDSPSRSRSPCPDRLELVDQPQQRPQPKKMPKQLSTNVTSLGLRAVDDPMMARLVIGGKTMGFVLVKEPQTRAEAAAMQVTIPLEQMPGPPLTSMSAPTTPPKPRRVQLPTTTVQRTPISPYSAVELFGNTMRLRRAITRKRTPERSFGSGSTL